MKNLKKVLALALAVIMVMSMFTVAFAAETKTAADLSDYAEITKKDAVNLTVDLGIIAGKPDGSFDPAGNIDRASWAKMVYYVATGDDNADAFKGANTTLKDISGNWAEGYIAYMAANGYVSGDLNGNFNPSSNVTVAEACKMILTVLGYDATDRGYQNNAAWSGNIMTDAKRNGLMDNVDADQTALVALDRENAAQIIYNALSANMVKTSVQYDQGIKYVTGYTKIETLGYMTFGVMKVIGTVDSINSDGTAQFKAGKAYYAKNENENVGAGSINGKATVAANLVGEEVCLFVKVTGAGFDSNTGDLNTTPSISKVVSTSVAAVESVPAATITAGVDLTDLTTAGKDDYVGPAVSGGITYYVNGTKQANSYDTDPVRGDLVKVYTNTDGDITIVKIIDYNWSKLSKNVETKTVDGELQVRVNGSNNLSTGWLPAANITGWEGLEKNDRVLFYAGPVNDDGDTYVIEKPEVATGSVTKKTGSSDVKLTIDGTARKGTEVIAGAGNATALDSWNVKKLKDNTYDFYLDVNGSVIDWVLVDGETETSVAYVLQTGWVTGSGSMKDSNYMEAKLMFADGTTEVVKVGAYKNTTDTYDIVAGSTVSLGAGEKKYDDVKSELECKFVDYSIDSDGEYTLNACTDDSAIIAGTAEGAGKTTAQKAAFAASDNLIGNNKTVFFVQKGTGSSKEYMVFTGIKNLPEMNLTADVVSIEEDDVVTYAFLTAKSFNDDAPEGYIYIADENDYSVDTDGLDVFVIYDAEGGKDEMAVANKNIVTAAGWYSVTAVNEDNGNTLANVSFGNDTLTTIGNGIVVIGSGKYTYDEDTVFCVAEWDSSGTSEFVAYGSFDADSFNISTDYTYTAKAVADSDNYASYVYVMMIEK